MCRLERLCHPRHKGTTCFVQILAPSNLLVQLVVCWNTDSFKTHFVQKSVCPWHLGLLFLYSVSSPPVCSIDLHSQLLSTSSVMWQALLHRASPCYSGVWEGDRSHKCRYATATHALVIHFVHLYYYFFVGWWIIRSAISIHYKPGWYSVIHCSKFWSLRQSPGM